MILSMTGFASKTATLPLDDAGKINMTISLKSLNSRYFEATCRLPYIFNHLETEFIKLFKKKLHRGHIYFTIHISNQQHLVQDTIEPALSVIKEYINATKRIQDVFHLEGSLSLSDLLRLPNVFNVEEKVLDEAARQHVFEIINTLIDELIIARQQEGTALQKDLEQRIAIMQQEINKIEQASQQLIEKQKNKVLKVLKEVEGKEGELLDARKQALYLVLDKIDIHEEIIRFKSHLDYLSKQLKSPDLEKGKRLDFTLQELAREINTIAAKCSDAAIGSLAINIKVELEKAREQAQNIV